MTSERLAWGAGLTTTSADGTVLDTWFPEPSIGPAPTMTQDQLDERFVGLIGEDPRRNVDVSASLVEIELDSPISSTADAYLRLHLLSHLLVTPNSIALDGIFGHLPIVTWTNAGPVAPEDFGRLRRTLQAQGISAYAVDKFPRLLDYLTPARVRIADGGRVRLGAYLSPGTTVMHEGFVNYNAGTLGASMVEGRISQGVVVGDGSDVGGGASIMGTLSGGGTERITVGERALLGANSGIGISIGDDCVVEAGLYLTAGTKVAIVGDAQARTVKASALSGNSNLLFRRNSVTGAVEAVERSGNGVQLNAALHA